MKNRQRLSLWIGLGTALLAFGAACQREVTTIGNESGRLGARGGAGGSSAAGAELGCGSPAPHGMLTDMVATAVASTGTSYMTGECVHQVGDSDGHSWKSDCDLEGCRCEYDGETLCSCTFDGSMGCETDTCCPAPWVGP
jgi:hypothetical protein